MNKLCLFSVLFSLLIVPATTYGMEFRSFHAPWLWNLSAETPLTTPAVFIVRDHSGIRELPLSPEDVNDAAFSEFDFGARALVFFIAPALRSSAVSVTVSHLAREGDRLKLSAEIRQPSASCETSDDLILTTTVVSIRQADAEKFRDTRFTPILHTVRYSCQRSNPSI